MNPFIHIPYYPDFEKMTPELARDAFRQLLPEAKRLVTKLEQSHEPTWEGLTQPLYDACYPLTHA